MTVEANAPVMPLEEVEQVAAFEGFTPEDFAVFEVPGFEARMPLVRNQIKPKLIELGQLLTNRLSETLEEPVHPHVAQHLRRTVNAPEETWVAFARSRRAYKPFVHLRAAVGAEKVRLLVFVEDYADDKALFAANLERNAEPLSLYLAHHPPILAYELPAEDGEPARGHALDADTLREFAQRLQRVKGQHAVFGIAYDKSHPVVANGPEFVEAVMEVAGKLKPLYDCGKPDFRYEYIPEPINVNA